MINLFAEFQEFRKILCICPCCGGLHRLSDLHLKAKGPAIRTWLDLYEQKVSTFEEKEEKIREKNVEKGQKEANKIISKSMHPILKKMKIEPKDVSPLMHPADFIIFNGMTNKKEISNIIFLSKKTNFPQIQILRKQVESLVNQKNYNFQLYQIKDDGNIGFK